MKSISTILKGFSILGIMFMMSCEESDPTPQETPSFVLGVEAATGTDVLLTTDTITSGTVSPIGNGVEQPAWMSYYSFGDRVATIGYSTDNTTTVYEIVNDELEAQGSFVTELGIYSVADVDDNTALMMGVTRAGYEDRIIYTIDKTDISIAGRVYTKIDERQEEGLVAFPTGMLVRGDKLFVAYYLLGAGEIETAPAFSTPNSNQARVAIYSYPELEFENIITDDRTTDVGCYSSVPALQEDENGNIYSFSTSSLASGFYPTPINPSGFLKINSGETDFDDNYFFDFESASGGYKINNAVYAGNGKFVVRAVKDDSGLWATYNPVAEDPVCYILIADVEDQSVTLVSDVPAHGGEWGMANLVHDDKVYINVSNATSAYIYEIDPATASATKGAKVDANWTKGIFAL